MTTMRELKLLKADEDKNNKKLEDKVSELEKRVEELENKVVAGSDMPSESSATKPVKSTTAKK